MCPTYCAIKFYMKTLSLVVLWHKITSVTKFVGRFETFQLVQIFKIFCHEKYNHDTEDKKEKRKDLNILHDLAAKFPSLLAFWNISIYSLLFWHICLCNLFWFNITSQVVFYAITWLLSLSFLVPGTAYHLLFWHITPFSQSWLYCFHFTFKKKNDCIHTLHLKSLDERKWGEG